MSGKGPVTKEGGKGDGGAGGHPARPANRLAIAAGVERILYRAAVDIGFRKVLLDDRSRALEEAGSRLLDTEREVLDSVPPRVLKSMVRNVERSRKRPGKLMRAVAGCALAATTALVAVDCSNDTPKGARPDVPSSEPAQEQVLERAADAGAGEQVEIASPDWGVGGARPE